MSMPPTSPRLKFIHTHPGRSPIPRRPPRHPSSPSARSRSLELIDQTENKVLKPVKKPEPLPRPRSRSLDGLLDDDGLVESPETSARTRSRSSIDTTVEKLQGKKIVECSEGNSSSDAVVAARARTSDNEPNPLPVPRLRTKLNSSKVDLNEAAKTAAGRAISRISSSSSEGCTEKRSFDDFPDRSSSRKVDGQIIEDVVERNTEDDCDKGKGRETIYVSKNEKPCTMLLKAKSCGAGLDDNEMFSSDHSDGQESACKNLNSHNHQNQQQQRGSLLSLHATSAADPKRKRNFMNKCVNKVRSFIKK